MNRRERWDGGGRIGGPEEKRGDGAPGAGAGFAEAGAEEGGDCLAHKLERAFGWSYRWEASVVIVIASTVRAHVAEVVEDFGVEDGGADLVDAGGPLAEIDLAAAIGTESCRDYLTQASS